MYSVPDESARSPAFTKPVARHTTATAAVAAIAPGESGDQRDYPAAHRVHPAQPQPYGYPASGPNSGPTTIAPTIVIGELVATPIAASRHASTMNAMNTQVSVESSPVREMTSSR